MSHDEHPEIPSEPDHSADAPHETGDAFSLKPEAASEYDMLAARPAADPLNSDSDIQFPERPPRKGRPFLAWVAIIALVTVIVTMNMMPPPEDEVAEDSGQGNFQNLTWDFQGKLIVGMADLLGEESEDQFLSGTRQDFEHTFDGRLRLAVLVGELQNPKAATKQLAKLENDFAIVGLEPTEHQRDAAEVLSQLYADYADEDWGAPNVHAPQRELLTEELGWFGSLALTPKESPDKAERSVLMQQARMVTMALMAACLGLLLVGFAGLGGSLLFVALALGGKLQRRLIAGAPHGGVYAETFALWMALFLMLTLGSGELSQYFELETWRFVPTLLAMFTSLIALAWPVARGISWRQVRRDIGWGLGQNPILEAMAGAAGWVSTLPLLAVGIMCVFLLILLRDLLTGGGEVAMGPQGPGHPIVEWLADSDWRGKLQLVLLACVAAPIVEETMFRGVLYRQLRDATFRWSLGISILVAAVVNSFVFAVIHPQGWLAVPALMSLALGFSFMREWRGSLLAPMTAHGINNAAVTSVILIFF